MVYSRQRGGLCAVACTARAASRPRCGDGWLGVNIVAYIVIGSALIILAIGAWVILGKIHVLEKHVKALWPLEEEVANQYKTIAEQGRDIQRLRVDKAAQDTIILEQSKAIERLQAEMVRLDAAWQAKFDALCEWVRVNAPDADIDGFLVQLRAGQG